MPLDGRERREVEDGDDVERIAEDGGARGEDADDGSRPAVERELFVDDVLIAAEAALPEAVAEEDGGAGVAAFVVGSEVAAEDGLDAHDVEEVAGDLEGGDAFGAGGGGEGGHAARVERHVSEGVRAGAPVAEVGVRDGEAANGLVGVGGPEGDDAIAVAEWEGLEEDGVRDAEDGGVGADAEGDGQGDEGREPWSGGGGAEGGPERGDWKHAVWPDSQGSALVSQQREYVCLLQRRRTATRQQNPSDERARS